MNYVDVIAIVKIIYRDSLGGLPAINKTYDLSCGFQDGRLRFGTMVWEVSPPQSLTVQDYYLTNIGEKPSMLYQGGS